MKRMCVFLAGILVILITFACGMPLPSSIELKSDRFEINAPIKFGRFNLVSILSEVAKDVVPEGFEIYDMVNYPNAQAFLIGYQMDLMESFNPDDYLKDLKMPEGIDPIYPEPITIPKMTSDTISDTWFYFDMNSFFVDMQERINDTSTPPGGGPIAIRHNVGQDTVIINNPPGLNLPPFMVFKENGGEENFEAAFVHTGRVVLGIELVEFGGGQAPEELTIRLTDIEMKGAADGNPIGRPVDFYGNPIGDPDDPQPQTVELRIDNGHSRTIYIDLSNEAISNSNPPKFSLGSIVSVYTGDLSSNKTFTFRLVMKPQLDRITLRGAKALKIGEMGPDLPPDIVDNIKLGSVGDMLNADIEEGNFRITATPPHSDPSIAPPPDTTYCKGLKIGYRILMEQDSVDIDISGVSTSFYGLNDWFWDAENGGPGGDSLAGKSISGKDLRVNQGQSKIIIKADPILGATFELFDDNIYYEGDIPILPYTEKKLPIKMDMGMNIEELKVVRWKGSVLPHIDIPEIDFSNMGDQNVSFINWIKFNEINLNVDFTNPPPSSPSAESGLPKELDGHIALKVSCPELGFDDTKPLQEGMNIFTKETNPGEEIMLEIHDNNKVKKIKFDVALIPVITDENEDKVIDENSPYMEFGPVDMRDGKDITMNMYAQVTVDFNWTEAEIDIKSALIKTDSEEALTGTFPKNAGDGTGKNEVDLSELHKYMYGVTFSANLKAKVFLSGPEKIVSSFQPNLDFDAQWGVDDPSPPPPVSMVEDQKLVAGDKLPTLPGKNPLGEWVYSGTALPEGAGLTMGGFDEIIAAFPRDLYFNYKMVLGDEKPVIVYHDTFKDVEGDSKIKALMVLLMPLELEVLPGGYFSIPGDIFGVSGDSENGEVAADLFGRKSPGDFSLFTGVNIKSLGIKMDFGYSLFAGSYLHFDRDKKIFGENGFYMGENNSLNIIFIGEQQRIINDNLIYPDIRFVYPNRRTLQIGRYALPVRIVITASGSYTLNLDDFDDLFGSGN